MKKLTKPNMCKFFRKLANVFRPMEKLSPDHLLIVSITGDEFTIIREGSTEKLALALATAETNDSGDIPNLIDCTLDHVLEMRSEKCHMDQTLIDAYKLLKNKK